MDSITLDTNALHPQPGDPDPAATLAKRLTGKLVVLPDVVISELFNSANWRNFSVARLARLHPYVDSVYPGLGMAEMMRKETLRGRPIWECRHTDYVIDELRKLIRLAHDKPEEAAAFFDGAQPTIASEMAKRRTATVLHRPTKDKMYGEYVRVIGPTALQAVLDDYTLVPQLLRKMNYKRLHRIQFEGHLREWPNSRLNPQLMADRDCIFCRLWLAMLLYTVMDHGQRPHVDRNERFALSDHNDKEIVVTGTYTEELYTLDNAKGSKGKGGPVWIDKALRLAIRELLYA